MDRVSKTGHSHRKCPNRNNVPAAAVHSMDTESGYLQQIPAMQEVCVTFVELRGLNNFLPRVFSLFDSGSPRRFINENLVSISLFQKLENSGYCGLGNSALLSLGRINCRIKYRKNEIKHEFIILSKNCMSRPIIIGRDVMPKLKVTLAILQHKIYDKSTLLNHKLSSIIPPLKTHVPEKLCDLGILIELGGNVQVGKKLSTKLLTSPQDEGTINTFLQLCAIDTSSDNDALFDISKDLLDEQISLVARTVKECYCKFPLEKIIPPEYGKKISLMHVTPIFSKPRR